IRGETGTGKELVAQAIQQESQRRDGPFVSVNLAAVPASLASAELFGVERGAYTGAVRRRPGFFEQADGGTLFLDEIGEVPVDVQALLLRVLETGEAHLIGGQDPHSVDVRVIAATDADLDDRIRDGSFRSPLLHRLAGFEIWLPPLRRRRDDLGLLIIHFLCQELARLGMATPLERNTDWLPASIVACLAQYNWPGNIRELRNVVSQLVVANLDRPQIELTPCLEQRLTSSAQAESIEPMTAIPAVQAESKSKPMRRRPSEISEKELRETLEQNAWDVKATAKALGVSRSSLYILIDQSDTVRTARSLPPEQIRACAEECKGNINAMVTKLQVSRSALRRRMKELGFA
ncbi:MAG: sigma 54-interacting transcriptional regulator, partial [Myxococcota bacterium]